MCIFLKINHKGLKLKKLGTFSLGIALFTMLFGAGNVVYPLILGRTVEGTIIPGLIGFIITGVAVPVIGFIATMLYEGNYEKFFDNIGKVPAAIVIFIVMIIVGILAASRCMVISYASVQQYIPWCSLFTYTFIVAIVIFLLTFKENMVVKLLGRVLGPVKITLLLTILILVIINITGLPSSDYTKKESFVTGFKNGYFSLDLFGALFFSHLIFNAMKEEKLNPKKLVKKGTKVGLIGGALLALIYSGFAIVAAIHGKELHSILDENLFASLASTILGNVGGVLANTAVAVATLTTAMSLFTVFADYLCFEIFKGKIPYILALIFTILINVGVANLKFSGIMTIIAPLAYLIYPSLITLSIAGILKKLYNFKYVKSATFTTFFITVIGYALLHFEII